MSAKLTDTQLVMLSAAAQRQDRCIEAPPSLKGAAAQKIATKLVAAGLVEEIKAKAGAYVWRRDDATGQVYALKVTAAGLKAIAVEDAETAEAANEISPATPGEGSKVDHETAVGTLRGRRRSPRRAKVQNSGPSWTCSDARAALRLRSWPTRWVGFPIPPAPR